MDDRARPGQRLARRELRPVTTLGPPRIESPESFSFVGTGDGRAPLPNMPFPRVQLDIMREIALLGPAFVLYTGDSVWGYGASRQELLNDYDRFRALADSTGVPLYNAPGNHEMQSDPAAVEILRDTGQDLYGSFDVGRYHFVALNTDEVNREGRVTGEQLAWLRADLAASRDAAGIFVFMHRPLFSWFQGDFNPDDGEMLQELFRSHPVSAVFAAHDHFYYEEERDGVRYVTAGGGGGPLYTQPPAGGFGHYVLVTVGPGAIDYNVIEPGHLEVDYVAGNDGIEPVSTARIMNTTDRELLARNVPFRVPRLSPGQPYRLSVDYLDWERRRPELSAELRSVEDQGDGSVLVTVAVPLPEGTALRLTVEAREPPDLGLRNVPR